MKQWSFGAVKLTRNAITKAFFTNIMKEHFKELGHEYDNEPAQNFVIFDVDNSSSRHSVNFRNFRGSKFQKFLVIR